VGARRFLIAYNIYLDTPNVTAARAIAKEIRASGGGLSGVKAMGVLAHGMAQISMNITDFRQTSVADAYAAVKRQAAKHRTQPVRGELIGLLPEAAFEQDSEWVRQLHGFNPQEKLLERKLEHPIAWPVSELDRAGLK
jgi:glutamate formiminotransferase